MIEVSKDRICRFLSLQKGEFFRVRLGGKKFFKQKILGTPSLELYQVIDTSLVSLFKVPGIPNARAMDGTLYRFKPTTIVFREENYGDLRL